MAEQLILSNGIIQATFSTKGAELLSVIKDGQEKIWIGDPDVWQLMGGISAPLLLFRIITERKND